MKNLLLLLLMVTFTSCAQDNSKSVTAEKQPYEASISDKGYKKAYFASGCFWCSESIYDSVFGVIQVISGYSGGTGKNPTYNNYIRKGHAEAIEVTYDPKVIDFESLLDVYFASQNVTQQNGQGPDVGSGYRSIIFYQNAKEKAQIDNKISAVQKNYAKPIAAEVKEFERFWEAEEYHQDYKGKNPNNPYIRNVSLPRLNNFEDKLPDVLKKNN